MEIDVDERIQREPLEILVVTPGDEAVAHPEPENVRRVDAVDRCKLGKIERGKNGRRNQPVELQNLIRTRPHVRHVGVVRIGLDDVHQTIQTEEGGLHIFVFGGKFE